MRKIACYFFSAALLASVAACTKKEKEDPAPVVTGVRVVALTPARGAVGTVVVLKGSNFSENPNDNAVAFNGTAAQVTAATAYQLTTTVPAGAGTGKVTVTVDGKTSTSQVSFNVDNAPSIATFSPVSGGPGTQVTLDGSDFSYVPEDNLVRFNGIIARVVAATTTQLNVLVPAGAATGKITVEANGYKGTSAADYTATTDWTRKADFPGSGRHSPATFTIGNKAYLGTGYHATGNTYLKDFWEFDPATNTWTQKADFGGTARYGAVGFAIGNKGYIGTSGALVTTETKKDFWEYDPSTNVWTRKADFGGAGRDGASGFVIGNKGYIGAGLAMFRNLNGSSSQELRKDFWEFDPATNTWTQKADFGGTARYQAVGMAIGNKGYIGTGSASGAAYLKDFWEYDPATNQWAQKADMPGNGRNGATSFGIGNKGYIAGGQGYDISTSNSVYLGDVWEYDPQGDRWARKADLAGGGRYQPAGFAVGTKGYITTGSASYYDLKKDLWEYTPR